jgi:hypothetical protein
MPLIVDVADIRAAIAFDDLDSVNLAIEQAIEQAQQSVADTVRSSFERGTVTDEFWVTTSLSFGGSNPQVELLLSQGFMDSGQAITVYSSGSQAGLSDSGLRTNLKSYNGTDHAVFDYNKGLLRVVDFDISKQYVSAAYTAGFEDDGGSPAIYTGTPEWLKQAVRLKTQLVLDANPIIPKPTGTGDGDGGMAAQILSKTLSTITMAHARYVPGSWKPYRSF